MQGYLKYYKASLREEANHSCFWLRAWKRNLRVQVTLFTPGGLLTSHGPWDTLHGQGAKSSTKWTCWRTRRAKQYLKAWPSPAGKQKSKKPMWSLPILPSKWHLRHNSLLFQRFIRPQSYMDILSGPVHLYFLPHADTLNEWSPCVKLDPTQFCLPFFIHFPTWWFCSQTKAETKNNAGKIWLCRFFLS